MSGIYQVPATTYILQPAPFAAVADAPINVLAGATDDCLLHVLYYVLL